MAMSNEQFDKYMQGDVTGWTAYLALEKVLKRWYELSGEEYAEWLYTSLRSDPALMIDLQEAIEERGEGNKSVVEEVFHEEFKETREKLAQKIDADYNERMKAKKQE